MEETTRPSKTQRKREMEALQDTGAELVQLNAAELAGFDLPEELLDALLEAQRIRDFEGRRRQMQYVGKLMRSVDAEPIRARLEQRQKQTHGEIAFLRSTEQWRARLLVDTDALSEFVTEHPGADRERLRTLIASVKHDQSVGRAPRHSRELFRAVRECIKTSEGGRGKGKSSAED